MPFSQLETIVTPFLLIDENILKKNIKDVAARADQFNVSLRPHAKTHKSPHIARMQIESGAVGITVATIKEAHDMLFNGIGNIFIARPVVGEAGRKELEKLCRHGKISVGIDNIFHLEELIKVAKNLQKALVFRIEINCGQNRCGVKPFKTELLPLLRFLEENGRDLEFEGFFCHAGHVYSQTDQKVITEIAHAEAQSLIDAEKVFAKKNQKARILSVGTTPTARFKVDNAINEIRAGNYVFNDAIQVANGSAKISDCALKVIARVIAVYKDRCVIDAGSKALGLDKGAHGTTSVNGFGIIDGFPELIISRLSEEHGIIDFQNDNHGLTAGQLLKIIPNHACACANLFSEYRVANSSDKLDAWPIFGKLR